MGELRDLAKNIEKRIARIERRASDVAVAVAEAVLTDLVTVTPVDTSNALSNWQISLGSPPVTDKLPYVFGYKGSTRGVSGNAAIAAGIAALAAKQPGQSIFVSNLAPYIRDLDQRTSTQFAGGFTRRAAVKAREVVRASRGGYA